jgi:DNA (cytosine-5)-methyltransferase 1
MTRRSKRTVLSLFSGAGGLDVGLEAAGFAHLLCVESDEFARATLRRNRPRWRLSEPGDIHALSAAGALKQAGLRPRELTLLAGGPPCQPFSKSAFWAKGNGSRLNDPRARTLDAFMDVVDAALPKAVLIENVAGLVFSGKDEGFRHLLSLFERVNKRRRTKYAPTLHHLNAADYGVPQARHRVFIIASIDGKELTLPDPTHGNGPGQMPYSSAWDAIGDLETGISEESLAPSGRWGDLLSSIPEGRNYLWHTDRNQAKGALPIFGWRTRYWSFLLKLAKDLPAPTIQASAGPATGPFHWLNRRLSTRELCRLQTFPDSYEIVGSRLAACRQIGNAVPCAIGELLGKEIRRQLLGDTIKDALKLIPKKRTRVPAPQPTKPVAAKYRSLAGKHRAHPGEGLGPGARRRRGEP